MSCFLLFFFWFVCLTNASESSSTTTTTISNDNNDESSKKVIEHHLRKAFNKMKTGSKVKKLRLESKDQSSSEARNRIVGGRPVFPLTRYPYYTRIDVGFNPRCGGTLVAADMVLTAARCRVLSSARLTARVGENTSGIGPLSRPFAITRRIQKQISHPDFNVRNPEYDIMLLKLNRPIEADDVQPVILNFDPMRPINGAPVTAIGLGEKRRDDAAPFFLQQIDFNVIGYNECTNSEDFDWLPRQIVEDHMICAGKPGRRRAANICPGDFGGPLIIKAQTSGSEDLQVGIASFSGDDCADKRFPGVFIKISGHEQWIKDTICSESDSPPSFCDE